MLQAGETYRPLWNPTHTERLKKYHSDGCSASVIATRLNTEFGASYSRNAIIGRMYRLGLPKRRSRTFAAPKVPRAPRIIWHRPPKAQPVVVPQIKDLEIPLEQRRTLFELAPNTCRWPVGEATSPDFFFCGAEVQEDKPYCIGHCARAYVVRP